MEVNIQDYLSENEIKEIVAEEFRSTVKHYLRNDGRMTDEANFQRLISNHAYRFFESEIDKVVPNYKDDLIKKVVELIERGVKTYDLFRKKSAWEDEDSYAYKILTETVSVNREVIRKNMEMAIENFDYSNVCAEEVSDIMNEISGRFSEIADFFFNLKKNDNEE